MAAMKVNVFICVRVRVWPRVGSATARPSDPLDSGLLVHDV